MLGRAATATPRHHRLEQRTATRGGLAVQRDQVVGGTPVGVDPVDLLAARQGLLPRRELELCAAHVLDELVRDVERPRALVGEEVRAHAEPVDGGTCVDQRGDPPLVEVARHEDLHPLEPPDVELPPNLPQDRREIAASRRRRVQTNGVEPIEPPSAVSTPGRVVVDDDAT